MGNFPLHLQLVRLMTLADIDLNLQASKAMTFAAVRNPIQMTTFTKEHLIGFMPRGTTQICRYPFVNNSFEIYS